MPRTLRVAVLECDTPIPSVKSKLGGYGDIFESLLKRGVEANGDPEVTVEVSKWHVVENPVYPNPNEVDAFLLTGSKHDAFADDSWILLLTEYVKDVVQTHKKPVVGICFGHQILARALGAKVGRGDGWEISVDSINLTDVGKEVFGKDTLYLHQMHRDIVFEVPEGCQNLGFSGPCAIQGLYKPGKIISVQAHPEFNEYIMTNLVQARHDMGLFNDEMYQSGSSRAGNQHDGELVAKRIIQFLQEAVA
ncbi:hypothetical protein N7468_008871 [Penicillium chermesinum]|uniref:Glutamine amidotransferase domain-containing protein n=1 Tax=Penicillium chermesinum TaxID=63820 RepID=A0A9W9NGV6_9EURO|nr:uncharacterized protein N7468_008871 [Penicillium chermesinum]KAJ5219667.1 hypothetical protein N7468_008871 [Penicillium chermesinum]KAJ6153669.1 hypothetical protein N7470_006628 [Penicillium chermesinum]